MFYEILSSVAYDSGYSLVVHCLRFCGQVSENPALRACRLMPWLMTVVPHSEILNPTPETLTP